MTNRIRRAKPANGSAIGSKTRLLLAITCALAAVPARADGHKTLPVDLPGLVHFDAVRIDLPEMIDGAWSGLVEIQGESLELDLVATSLRTPDFELIVQVADGTLKSITPPPPSNVTGYVRDAEQNIVGEIRGTVTQHALRAMIRFNDRRVIHIQPAIDFDPLADHAAHAIYSQSDVAPFDGRCGVLDTSSDDDIASSGFQPSGACVGGFNLCRIAFDVDFEYYTARSSNIAMVMADIETVMSGVAAIYEDQAQISYAITTVIIRTDVNDPYTASNPNTLLSEFRSWWNANHQTVDRSVAHLMTGRDVGGPLDPTIGLAYLGQICSSLTNGFGYAFSQSNFSTVLPARYGLTAHELGHNWNASHCAEQIAGVCPIVYPPDCNIMCACLGGCAGDLTVFGAPSLDKIVMKRDSVTCLGVAPDCDENGVFDDCDLTTFLARSPRFAPLNGVSGSPLIWIIEHPPLAQNDVVVSFLARGDLSSVSEHVSVSLNDFLIGTVYEAVLSDCGSPLAGQIVIPESMWNALTAGVDARFTLTPTLQVDNSCPSSSYLSATVSYAADQDCNGNGIIDRCETEHTPSLDLNGNGVPDSCEPLGAGCLTCPGDMTGDGFVDGDDVQQFVSCAMSGSLGFCDCADFDNDGTVGMTDIESFVFRVVNASLSCGGV